MTAYNWPKIMELKSIEELQTYIRDIHREYSEEVISAAKNEIEKRKEQEKNQEPINIVNGFPEKPVFNESKQSLKKSVFSMILFIAAFYLIFKWDITYILILVGVILIHELGHYIAMRIFKYKDLSIFFIPLVGALASGQKEDISQKQKTIVSLAGPLPGLIIGTILEILGLKFNNDFLTRSGEVFIILNLFNLLPILPLDGGRVIKSLFFQSNEKINMVFLWISIALIGFIALKSQSYFLLIVPFFLFIQIRNQSQINQLRVIAEDKGINTNKNFTELTNVEYWLLRDELALNFKGLTNLIEAKRYVAVSAEIRVVNVIKQIIQKQPIKDINLGGKILFILIWLLSFLVPLAIVAYFMIINGYLE